MEVLTLSLKQLGIYGQIKFTRKPTKAGKLLTSMETRKTVWNYWYSNSHKSCQVMPHRQEPYSIKFRVTDSVSTVSVIRQCNRFFYQSICKTVQVTYKELYVKYIQNHEEKHHVSWGTFLSLRPFYIKPNTLKEIETCR